MYKIVTSALMACSLILSLNTNALAFDCNGNEDPLFKQDVQLYTILQKERREYVNMMDTVYAYNKEVRRTVWPLLSAAESDLIVITTLITEMRTRDCRKADIDDLLISTLHYLKEAKRNMIRYSR